MNLFINSAKFQFRTPRDEKSKNLIISNGNTKKRAVITMTIGIAARLIVMTPRSFAYYPENKDFCYNAISSLGRFAMPPKRAVMPTGFFPLAPDRFGLPARCYSLS
jgi:hypothetical protein